MNKTKLPQAVSKLKSLHPFVSATLIIWTAFFAAFWSQSHFVRKDHIYAKSLGTWADGAAHLTYISALAYQPTFPPHLPIYLGTPFIYPFFADATSAFLVQLGLNLFSSYSLMGFIFSLLFVFLCFSFFTQFLKNQFQAAVSLNLLLLSGGLGFIKLFQDISQQGLSLLTQLPREYTLLYQDKIHWLNLITGELIPQRPLLLGFSVGILILHPFWQLLTHSRRPTPKHFFLAGVLFGLLPIIHPHTMIALSFAVLTTFFFNAKSKTPPFPSLWFFFFLPALTLSLPLLLLHIKPGLDHSFIQWYPGWLARSLQTNWLKFYFLNWGTFLPLALGGFFLASPKQKQLVVPFILTFITANLFLFQPYDWDNSKILTWVYFILSPLASLALTRLSRLRPAGWFLASVLFILSTLTGGVDVIRQLQPHVSVPMYSPEDLQLAQFVKSSTPPRAIFLTSDQHTHPIPTLTGRQIVMGYRGWLWSYGIDYSTREKDIQAIYSGSPQAKDLINHYQIDYIVIGPSETQNLHPNLSFFNSNFTSVYQSPNYTLFATAQPTSP